MLGQTFSMLQVNFCFLAKTNLMFSSVKLWHIRFTVDLSWWVPEEGVNMHPASCYGGFYDALPVANEKILICSFPILSKHGFLSLFFSLLTCSQAAGQALPSSRDDLSVRQTTFSISGKNLQKCKNWNTFENHQPADAQSIRMWHLHPTYYTFWRR